MAFHLRHGRRSCTLSQPQPQPQLQSNIITQGSQVKAKDVLFIMIGSGWPTSGDKADKRVLGHMRRGETSAYNHLDMLGWAADGFPSDGTPRTCQALRIFYDTLPFAGPFRRQCEAGPLRIYEFCKPEHDTGYPHKPHVQKLIDDCKAALTLNPALQLVVVG